MVTTLTVRMRFVATISTIVAPALAHEDMALRPTLSGD
jgi:hypothetical protein